MRKQSGITLIALVITIIVLLILAAVSISAITGENGIVDKAKEAAEKTSTAKVEEASDLQYLEDQIGSATAKPGMNEYGFYFDELYVATITEDGGTYKLAYLFHEDGSAEMFVDDPEVADGYFICMMNAPSGTVNYDEMTISDDGLTLTEEDMDFVLKEVTLHGAYFGEEYVATVTEGTTVTEYVLVLNEDGTATATTTVTTDGVAAEPQTSTMTGLTLTGHNYIVNKDGSSIAYLSTDGEAVLYGEMIFEKE